MERLQDFIRAAAGQFVATAPERRGVGGQDDGRWSHSFDRLSFGYGRHRGVNKVTAMSKASK